MKFINIIITIFALFVFIQTVGNPGILISVPFPLSPPTIDLPLPFPVDNILISSLQLNNILLTTVDYNWKLNLANAEVNVSLAQLEFDWFYKHDKGKGTFTETNLKLQIYYSFVNSKTNHFQINITSTKIVPGHSKVVLSGAGIPEIIIVQVTNLILNHASLLFRGIIAKKISQTITNLASDIGEDRMLYQDKTSGKQFYLNTSLVASPITSGQNLLIQINAAPYIKGSLSGSLNPSDVLIRANSTKIQVQIHKQLISRLIALILQARGGTYDVSIHMSDITSVIQIKSLLLCSIFPKMVYFQDERDVTFNVKITTVDFALNVNNLKFDLKMFSNVQTHNTIDKKDEIYMNRVDGAVRIQLEVIYGVTKNSIRLTNVEALQFSPSKSDIQSGLIIPQGLMNYIDILTGWLTDAFNLELNRFVKDFTFKNIQVSLKGSGIKNIAYLIQIDLLSL